MHFQIEESWDTALHEEYEAEYFIKLSDFILQESFQGKVILPPKNLIFNALQKTPLPSVKVVIVGQDPYHGLGQAHGLAFSVPKGIKPPPSLQNIFKELVADVGMQMPTHGSLEAWAEQGVLLLNAILTVEEGSPLIHKRLGWQRFTDAIIRAVASRHDPAIFLLWGQNAIMKCDHVQELKNSTRHVILTAPHPSPLSAYNGFFGCRHFSKCNELLKKFGKSPINWQI